MSDIPAVVIDVETTMRCPVGNNKANPFWPENAIVLTGGRNVNTGVSDITDKWVPLPHLPALFIGHNIAFDLHHLMCSGSLTQATLGITQIWDTQLAEYLLSNQQLKFPSLDECIIRRSCGTLKDNRVSTMFAAGMGADVVPRNLLEDYLRADLLNTEQLFLAQYKEADERGMLPLLWSQMDARLATIEMVYNGMKVDKGLLADGITRLTGETLNLSSDLRAAALLYTSLRLDPTKPNDLSLLLFGGVHKWKAQEHVGKYKNGKDKLKWVEKERRVLGIAGHPLPAWLGKNGYYSTADNVLEHLARAAPTNTVVPMVQLYREKHKQLSTYYEGLDALVMPDGRIHQQLNHCATNTGRLSSSQPNLQNVTDGSKGSIKEVFVSRWGADGVIIEADYKQLEMIVLAVLSKDAAMIKDIKDGVDMHDALYWDMHGKLMMPDQRQMFKRCTFALVYGAGANGIAMQTGVPLATAKKFIYTFYNRYAGVARWHEETFALVESTRVYSGWKDAVTGLPIGLSSLVSPISHRCHEFHEYPLDPAVRVWKKKDVGFSPTEIKNYPVQGGATADIVPLVLGKLFRVLRHNPTLAEKCLMVNTIHDSVLFDCHTSVVTEAVATIRTTMEAAPRFIKEQWGFDFPLPLNVSIKYGSNWKAIV